MRNLRAHPIALALGASLLAFVAGCGPSENGGRHAGHALLGMHHGALPLMTRALRMGMRGTRGTRGHGFRRACAGDVSKLCPNSGTRKGERECLEQKRDKLSADCRSALDTRRNRNDTDR